MNGVVNNIDNHLNTDLLAVKRTDLAIERTLLAYLRTSLTLVIVGITFIKFFSSSLLITIGWFFIPASVAIFVYGVIRCNSIRNKNKIFETFDE